MTDMTGVSVNTEIAPATPHTHGPSVEKKSATFYVRLTPTQRKRLDAIHTRFFSNDSAIGSALIDAFCDHVERTGKLESPLVISTAPAPKAKSA
ncbi:MAG TPA: hypothetical protein VK163_01015 [Opitutaceae bacterium]|nr:hypothetical protein [Opitutaceae bacterium]